MLLHPDGAHHAADAADSADPAPDDDDDGAADATTGATDSTTTGATVGRQALRFALGVGARARGLLGLTLLLEHFSRFRSISHM